jgi:hypothetical protein
MTISTTLFLLIHEHGICFHLLQYLSSVFEFSRHWSFTSLFRLIPRIQGYCGNCFLDFFHREFVLVYRKSNEFVWWLLCSAILLKVLSDLRVFCWSFQGLVNIGLYFKKSINNHWLHLLKVLILVYLDNAAVGRMINI